MAASVAGPGDGSPATSFVSLPAPASGAFSDPDVASFLKKWDLAPNARVLRFRYTKPFHRMDASAFLRDFFSSSAAREHFRVVDRAGTWRPIAEAAGADAGAKCVAVDHALVPCDAVSMSLFDPILDDAAANPPIVRPGTDSLARRVDDVIEGFQVADELRDWLLNPDNENARDRGILPADHPDRAQFVFRVFEHLVLGGAMCQFEDRVTPYLDVAKRLYKALVRAKPDPNDPKRVKTASDVYAVEGVAFAGAAAAAGAGAGEETNANARGGKGKGKGGLFPEPGAHRQNFCYFAVDARRRHVTVWYHGFRAYW